MKMKMKMAFVAGALALSMAGQASAAIVTGTTGASNLILSIWDTTTATSYTADLGININSFLSGVSGTSTALTANGASVGNQTFAADPLLASYLAGVNTATTVWNVTAIDNFGINGFSVGTPNTGKALVSTFSANIKSPANSLASTQSNPQLNTAIGTLDLYYTQANNASGAATSVTAGAADQYYAATKSGQSFLTSPSTGAIGSTLNFWYLTPSSTSAIQKASVAQFQGVNQAATWTLASNGTLTYTVGAVPEPGEWLLMLSGLGLIGFIATRRKNAGSMTFA
jgi:hypothetical protein